MTKGIADVVLLKDQFSRLPQAVGEGRRIARNIHRLGRLYLTKTVYAAALILLVAVPGFAFPFLPRHLTLAALLTIGIPSFVLALAPSDGPALPRPPAAGAGRLRGPGRGRRSASARSSPSSSSTPSSAARSRGPHRGDDDADRARPRLRPAARARARAASTSRSRATCWRWSPASAALFALILAAAPVRDFFDLELLTRRAVVPLPCSRPPPGWSSPARSGASPTSSTSRSIRAAPAAEQPDHPRRRCPCPNPPQRRKPSRPRGAAGSQPGPSDEQARPTAGPRSSPRVGPASRSPKMLERLIDAGADVFRLNFSHGDRERATPRTSSGSARPAS